MVDYEYLYEVFMNINVNIYMYGVRSIPRSSRSQMFFKISKYMFLEVPQISQENTCVGVSFLIKLQAGGLIIDLKII